MPSVTPPRWLTRGLLGQVLRAASNWMFILGFRPDYRVENLLITIAVASILLLYLLAGAGIVTVAAGTLLLLAPLLVQYREYRRKLRRSIQLPLYVILMSGVAAFFVPYLLIPAIINSIFVEDFTIFLRFFDVVGLKRAARILLAPVTRRDLFILITMPTLSAAASFLITGSPLVLAYPLVAYLMVTYSLIVVPPEYRAREERARNVLEEVSRRVSILYFLFNRIYLSPRMSALAREAGMIGYEYHSFVRTMGGLFTVAVYASLAFSPLLYILLGRLAFLLVSGLAVFFLLLPYIILFLRRAGRAGKISRNIILILAYFAAMKAVAESFRNMMLHLKSNVRLAKLFGLDDEAALYHKMLLATGSESEAARMYADSIPDEFYRDTVRTMMDIEEHEGVGAVFRMLVARLRDFTGRYIDRVSATFENIGGNVISVIVLAETAIPIMMFLTAPTLFPIFMLAGGILGAFLIFYVANLVLPDLPSEFIYSKPRYRMAAAVFSVTALLLTVIESVLVPYLLVYLVVLNIPVAFWVALWYASWDDLTLNRMFFDKFSDLLVLFSSALAHYNSVEKAMQELSQQETFPARLRREFEKMARLFAYVNIQRLEYRGGYWYKFFLFLSSLAAIYGTTPRELYKAIGTFMIEFKRLMGAAVTFGRSMLFLTAMSLVIMTVEVSIAIQFLEAVQAFNVGAAAGALGIQIPFPTLTPEELEFVKTTSYLSLLVVAIASGVALAKVNSLTVRDGRYVLAMFLFELLLIYIAEATGFWIGLGAGT